MTKAPTPDSSEPRNSMNTPAMNLRTELDRFLEATADPEGEDHRVTLAVYLRALLASPNSAQPPEPAAPSDLSPSEAIYAFAGWITTRPGSLIGGETHGAAEWADAVERFRLAQGWPEPRPEYADRIKRYSHAQDAAATASATPSRHVVEASPLGPEWIFIDGHVYAVTPWRKKK